MTENVQTQEMKVIVFQLEDESYGVPVNQVKSIERMQAITRVPKAPTFVKGVINMRGVITPIIALRSRFDLEEVPHTDKTRMIIVSVGQMEVGLIVDAANDVIDIPLQAIEPPPSVVGVVERDYLNGVAKLEDRLLILLNLDKVLNESEVNSLKKLDE
ncbi:chemotaxis protein CheW [Aureibacillus halotolerans]|uniref:Purine-binding chemotaxis protein CheW n=1 Tax=Aureibacillus halotolerans TaxID=1508390 RepID=A0A4R6U517_9BACI|nr:chemotaxis protein CheW [Aureibacillus halotolerans]TDQ39669.1 purine-binding chemotaxis protein CheW [Aureibacillus halotolerans]